MKTNISTSEIEAAIQDHWNLQLGSYFSSVHDLRGAIYNLGDQVTDYYWNYAGLIRAEKGEEERVFNKVIDFAKENSREPAFYLDPTTSPDTFPDFLRGKEFEPEDEEVWMFYPPDQVNVNLTTNKNLEIVEVENDAQFADFIDIFHESYEMLEEGETTSDYGDSLIQAKNTPPEGVEVKHFIGYADNKPVSISSCYKNGATAGIYNVGTPIPYRRMGFGGALSNAAISFATESGVQKLILQTELGSPAEKLYKKLGFETGFTAVIWSMA